MRPAAVQDTSKEGAADGSVVESPPASPTARDVSMTRGHALASKGGGGSFGDHAAPASPKTLAGVRQAQPLLAAPSVVHEEDPAADASAAAAGDHPGAEAAAERQLAPLRVSVPGSGGTHDEGSTAAARDASSGASAEPPGPGRESPPSRPATPPAPLSIRGETPAAPATIGRAPNQSPGDEGAKEAPGMAESVDATPGPQITPQQGEGGGGGGATNKWQKAAIAVRPALANIPAQGAAGGTPAPGDAPSLFDVIGRANPGQRGGMKWGDMIRSLRRDAATLKKALVADAGAKALGDTAEARGADSTAIRRPRSCVVPPGQAAKQLPQQPFRELEE